MTKTIVFFGYFDPVSPRCYSLRKKFEVEGWTILHCNTVRPGLLAKCLDLRAQWNQIKKNVDTVLVMFPGQYMVPLAWLLTRTPRKRVLFDAFISLHDTLVYDRATVPRRSVKGLMLWCVDWLSTHMADEVILDTDAHRQFFIEAFGLRPEKVSVTYLQARSDLFYPRERKASSELFHIFFYGTYIPLQGVPYILTAFSLLEKQGTPFRATLVGSGQMFTAMKLLAEKLHLTCVTFVPFVPLEQLPQMMTEADLCLGIFGTTDKAGRVIPHKVYDAVAMGIPVITRDSVGIREKFARDPLVALVPAGDPVTLASSILQVREKIINKK